LLAELGELLGLPQQLLEFIHILHRQDLLVARVVE